MIEDKIKCDVVGQELYVEDYKNTLWGWKEGAEDKARCRRNKW